MKAKVQLPKLRSKIKINYKLKPLVLIVLLLIVTASITYAIFFSTTSIANKFESMKYDVSLEEEFNNDWGTKKVYIKNNEESTPVVVRVSYIEYWSKETNDELLTLPNKENGKEVVNKNWTSTWKNDFVLGSDGWYYYKKVLNLSTTIQLLESIGLDEEMLEASPSGESYSEYDYELTFRYEAIQATEKAVKQLWNKDITISGDNVTW